MNTIISYLLDLFTAHIKIITIRSPGQVMLNFYVLNFQIYINYTINGSYINRDFCTIFSIDQPRLNQICIS